MPNTEFADIVLKGGTVEEYRSFNELIRLREIALLKKIDNSYRLIIGQDSNIDNVYELGAPKIIEIGRNDRAGIMIPLYVYPSDVYNNVTYNSLIDLAKSRRDIPITVIVNPSSGPGAVVDANYTKAINRLQGANINVCGYVSTDWMNKLKTAVITDVDKWIELYPRIDGIFFDEGTYQDSQASFDYYSYTNEYSKLKGMKFTILNIGAPFAAGYYDNNCADIIIGWEDSTYPTDIQMKENYDGGAIEYNVNRRAALIHSQSTFDPAVFRELIKYYGWVYVTDDELVPNPWDTLGSYMEDMSELLDLSGPKGSVPANEVNAENTMVRFQNPDSTWGKWFSSSIISDWNTLANKPLDFPPSSHNHNDLYSVLGHVHSATYYTKSEADARYLQPLAAGYYTKTESDARYLQPLEAGYYTKTEADNKYLVLTGGRLTGKLRAPGFSLHRVDNPVSGYNYYSDTINAWQTYMSNAVGNVGFLGTLNATAGKIVTSWAMRSNVEPAAGYGWIWETIPSTTTGATTVVAELRSSDGKMLTKGGYQKGNFDIVHNAVDDCLDFDYIG